MTPLHPSSAPGVEHAGEAEAARHGPPAAERAELHGEGVVIEIAVLRHLIEESLAASEEEGAWRSAA